MILVFACAEYKKCDEAILDRWNFDIAFGWGRVAEGAGWL
jgi:hypothetical protein